MELTKSFERAIPEEVRKRYDLVETRNAAQVLAATNPAELAEVIGVLKGFALVEDDIVVPGGSKSEVALRLDDEFRKIGWREGSHEITLKSVLKVMPYRAAGETSTETIESEILSEGYKVDNLKGRIALDVEWHAKDGNLDRDVGNYRALYDAGIIDGGIIITRKFDDIRALSIRLNRPKGFSTTTTTTLEKLIPRLTRGDAGGCPILAVAITDRCFVSS